MRSISSVAISLSLTAISCGAAVSKDTTLPMVAVPGLHIPVIEVKVNGKGPYKFGIDTGAQGFGRVNPKLAEELGLKKVGQVLAGDPSGKNKLTLPVYQLDSIAVGDQEMKGVRVNAMAAVQGAGLLPIDGMLGFGAFKDHVVTIDYGKQQVSLSKTPLQAGQPNVVPFQVSHGVPAVDLVFGGKKVTCHLDTGSAGGIGLPMQAAKLLGLDKEMRKVGQFRTISGTYELFGAPYKGIMQVAGNTIPNPSLTFNDMMKDRGNVGVQFLGNYVLTFDQKSGLARLAPSGAKSPPKQLEKPRRYGFQIAIQEGGVVLMGTETGSVAEKGGFKKGDKLVRINGVEVSNLEPRELGELLRNPKIDVEFVRDGTPMRKTLEL